MHKFIEKAKKEKRSLLETEAKELLAEYNISIPAFRLIQNKEDINQIKNDIGYPIVMKIVSPEIIHKSDAGGVIVNIKNKEEAETAYQEIILKAKEYNDKARIIGVIAYEMVPQATEIIIGVIKDPHFGPVIMFGLGGIFVEVLKDVSFRVLPIEERDAEEMIAEIKGYKILQGIRGERPKDIIAIKRILMKISQLIMENPEIKEIDLNPVFVFEEGIKVVDARMIL